MTPCIAGEPVVGLVLAGGLSRRMGGREKAFLPFGAEVLLSRVLKRFAPQVAAVSLSANGDRSRFAGFDIPVIGDVRGDHPGPLAGIEAGFLHTDAHWMVCVPVDLPFLPLDLVSRLVAGVQGGDLPTVARCGGRLQPVVCLWPRNALPAIQSALDRGERRMMAWFAAFPHRTVEFALAPGGMDPFFNINHPDALVDAVRLDSLS